MFQIHVWDLLASYPGDSKELEFSGEVLPGYYEDIVFTAPLSFRVKLIALEDGVEVIFEHLDTRMVYEESDYDVHLHDIARTFRESYDPLLPDDIKFIDTKSGTIDLREVLREELLIATY